MADRKPNNPSAKPAALSEKEYEKLVKQVADRVWQMWREEIRRNRGRLRPKSGR
jgi:hypothetical protein